MERQVSVGPDQPVKEDHLWRWRKFPREPRRSIYVSTKISGNVYIMGSIGQGIIARKTEGKFILLSDCYLFQVS